MAIMFYVGGITRTLSIYSQSSATFNLRIRGQRTCRRISFQPNPTIIYAEMKVQALGCKLNTSIYIYILLYQSYPKVNTSIHTYRICIYSRTKANPQLNTSVYIYEIYILKYQNYLSPLTARSHLAVMLLTNLPGRRGILIHTLPFK